MAFSAFVLIDKNVHELNPIQIQIELKHIYNTKKKYSQTFRHFRMEYSKGTMVDIERFCIFLLNSKIIMKHQNSDHRKMECYSILKLKFDHKAVTTMNEENFQHSLFLHAVFYSEFEQRFVI